MRNKALTLPPVVVRTENQEYICAKTGALLHSIPMRRFYMWADGSYQVQREYQVEHESWVNPQYQHKGDTPWPLV